MSKKREFVIKSTLLHGLVLLILATVPTGARSDEISDELSGSAGEQGVQEDATRASTESAPSNKACKPIVKKFESARDSLLKCMESSNAADACKGKLDAMVKGGKAVHACLPEQPAGVGIGGSYNLDLSMGEAPAGCEKETSAWGESPIYQCIAKWNFAAHRTYQPDLPKDDCSAALAPYFAKKKNLSECAKRKKSGPMPKIKVIF